MINASLVESITDRHTVDHVERRIGGEVRLSNGTIYTIFGYSKGVWFCWKSKGGTIFKIV